MITSDDYTFTVKGDQDIWVVHLLTGEWKDTYYTYGRIKIEEPEEGWDSPADGKVNFDYGLIESPIDLNLLVDSQPFKVYIGEILKHIIEESFNRGDYQIGKENGKSGNDNTTKLDQQ